MKSNENEDNFNKLIDSHDQLNQSYKNLLNDHEQLQKLYLQLESEYDDLYAELSKKHAAINGLHTEIDEVNTKYMASLDMIDSLESSLKAKLDTRVISVGTETEQKGKKRINFFFQLKWHTIRQNIKLGDVEGELDKAYRSRFESLNLEINELNEKRESVECKLKELSVSLEHTNEENEALKGEQAKLQADATKQYESIQMQFIQINQLNGKIQVSLKH